MKRIAIVDPASYALTYDYQYIKALSRYYDVDFYCSYTKYNYDYIGKIKKLNNVNVFEYNVSGVNRFVGLLNLLGVFFSLVFKSSRYTSINVQWSVVPLLEIPFYFILKNKLIYTFHNSKPHNSNSKTSLVNRLISKLSKCNLFVSDFTKKTFEDDYCYTNSKNLVLKHGVMPLSDDCNQVVSSDDNSNTLNLVFWGNVKPYKGLEFILDCVPFLQKEGIPVKVYGKFDYNQLYIHRKLIEMNQESINDYLPLDYIHSILLNRDNLLVLPYKNGSQSGIMYNCLACGTPFISSNTGESAQFLRRHGLGKLVFEYGNVHSLLCSIDYYSREKKDILSKFKSLKDEYSWCYDSVNLKRIFG